MPLRPPPHAVDQQAIHYSVSRHNGSAVVSLTDGTFTVAGNQLEILAANGSTLASEVPLTFHVDNKVYPISATI